MYALEGIESVSEKAMMLITIALYPFIESLETIQLALYFPIFYIEHRVMQILVSV